MASADATDATGSAFFGQWPVQPPRLGRTAGQFDHSKAPVDVQDYGHRRAVNRNKRSGPSPSERQVPILRNLPVALPTIPKRKVAPRIAPKQPENGDGTALQGKVQGNAQGKAQAQAFKVHSPYLNSRRVQMTPSPALLRSQPPSGELLRHLTSSPSNLLSQNPPSPNSPSSPFPNSPSSPSLNPQPFLNHTYITPTSPTLPTSPTSPTLPRAPAVPTMPAIQIPSNVPAAQQGFISSNQISIAPPPGATSRDTHVADPSKQRAMEQPLLKQDEWKRYPEVWVQIGPGLTGNVSIRDIFISLQDFGKIELIEMMLDRGGYKTGQARVKFSKVFYPFWEAGSIDFGSGGVRTTMRKGQSAWMVQSRVNPSRNFPGKISFEAKSLEFGFMLQPEEFMAMYTTKPNSEITWEVNLHKKKIELVFKLRFEKEEDNVSEVSGSTPPDTVSYCRTSIYMIEIPFTQLHELFMPALEDQNGTKRTFVIPLPDPPKYSRQLSDWTKSMTEPGMTHWTIYDAWMRQTDIEYDMKARQRRPVSLRHRLPIIDIGRWTTFRLSFDFKDTKKLDEFKIMMDALKDFNVRLKPLPEFYVNYDKSQLTPIWSHLDREISRTAGNSLLLQSPFLSFPVRYQLEVCISHGYLNEYNITPEFIDRLALIPERKATILLECVEEKKTRFFKPMEIFSIPRDKRADSTRSIPDYCVHMRRATVTPTGILFQTPSVEISNRVIRHFYQHTDRFIRISFTDEQSMGRIRFTDKLTSNELFSRVYRALEYGIVIGDRHYEFLAFGNSQLREHGAYFFAPTVDTTAATIRDWMGVFTDIRVVAKHASRLGQCFSTTKAFKSCKVDCVRLDDINRNGYCFTDGVGKMSPVVARLLTEEMVKPQHKPSAEYQSSCFQFRLGGCKGVLAVDPNIPNLEIHIRPSQRKFWSSHAKLEIIRCSQFASASLNRQLIQVMSSLGVPDEFFRARLRKILQDYNLVVTEPQKALELLMKHIDPNHITLGIANLVRGGLMNSREPFVMSLLHLWRAWTIKYLKEKAKITLDDSAFLLGVVDETAKLRGYYTDDDMDDLSQVFCQVSNPITGETRVITGRCIVARNPSLHPGDVRVVEAVDVPELHHLVDVVVFPQTGDRDVPSMLSGGDLDGDDYVVIWDEELTAQGQIANEPPASYIGQSAHELDRDVTIKDMTTFFVNYMKNDRLGAIANAHLAWADKMYDGVRSNICIELAQLHSDAVDYPKTGIKAQMGKKHRIREWPHFFDKPIEEGQYRSEKILGQLYNMVERVDFTPCYSPFNPKMMSAFVHDTNELQEARIIKAEYDASLRRIMAQHDIKTEFEVWSTFVMSHASSNDYKFHEEIGEVSYSLKERFRKQIIGSCTQRKHELPRKVAAMYVVTVQEIEQAKEDLRKDAERKTPRSKGKQSTDKLSKEDIEKLPLMSFPWVFPDVLVDISHGRLAVARDYAGPGHCDVSMLLSAEFEEVTIEALDGVLDDEGSSGRSDEGDQLSA